VRERERERREREKGKRGIRETGRRDREREERDVCHAVLVAMWGHMTKTTNLKQSNQSARLSPV
jgi:hypothetical protein